MLMLRNVLDWRSPNFRSPIFEEVSWSMLRNVADSIFPKVALLRNVEDWGRTNFWAQLALHLVNLTHKLDILLIGKNITQINAFKPSTI